MDNVSVIRVVALFFGTYLVFATVRRLTDGSPALVTLAAQLAVLAVIIAVIVLVMRRRGSGGEE